MKIGDLKEAIKDIFGPSINSSAGSDALILTALNSSRVWLERKHDFRLADVDVEITVTTTVGGDLNKARLLGSTGNLLDDDWTETGDGTLYVSNGVGFMAGLVSAKGKHAQEVIITNGGEANGRWSVEMLTETFVVIKLPGVSNQKITGATLNFKGALEYVRVKSIHQAYVKGSDGKLTPIFVRDRRSQANLKLRERSLQTVDRYPDDNKFETTGDARQVVIGNSSVTVYPAPANDVNLVLDANRWMPVYEHDDYSDFFTEFGTDFMIWQSVIMLNYKYQKFVPRTEGSLYPPEKLRDEALLTLLQWDNFVHNNGRGTDIYT